MFIEKQTNINKHILFYTWYCVLLLKDENENTMLRYMN
jgi:hypothetical protein